MPTQAELIARVRQDKTFTSTTVVSDADALILLNEGAVDMALKARAFPIKAQWSSIASTQTYILSGGASPKVAGFLGIYWEAGGLIYNDGTTTQPMRDKFRSESWLDLNIPGWQDVSASDNLLHPYLTHDTSGNLALGVHPKSSTAITNAFTLWYLSRGTDMNGSSNYPWTNTTTNLTHTEPFQKGIAYYALWQLHETKTFMDNMAQKYAQMYANVLLEFRASQDRIFAAEAEGLRTEGQLVSMDTFGSL